MLPAVIAAIEVTAGALLYIPAAPTYEGFTDVQQGEQTLCLLDLVRRHQQIPSGSIFVHIL